ncbi:hypothetical protein D3C80_2044770 [compost metagenome]
MYLVLEQTGHCIAADDVDDLGDGGGDEIIQLVHFHSGEDADDLQSHAFRKAVINFAL